MKIRLLLSLLTLAAALRAADEKAKNCGCDCCQGAKTCCCYTETAAADKPAVPAEQPKSHPVKGVIMGIMTEKTALLVKHEEVPGVMRAMTMMFKVEPAVLEKVQRGDAIKALMSRRADGWWLHEVKVIETAK
jgi:Cu/Ag efflux protein CusF